MSCGNKLVNLFNLAVCHIHYRIVIMPAQVHCSANWSAFW